MSEQNGNEAIGGLTALAVGALIGAGLTLLFAPCSGEETRARLARQAEDLKNKARDVLGKACCCMKNQAETAAKE
jgi:gas vesicle protein